MGIAGNIMMQGTYGQICYGILFEEGYEFPWGEKYDGDIDEWWIYEVNEFKHSFEIFNQSGEYLNGVRPAQDNFDKYYKEENDFKKTITPLPVQIVKFCCCDYPIDILAIKGTFVNAPRGDPTEITQETLLLPVDADIVLEKFCVEHGVAFSKPKWWLSSWWC